MSYFKVSYLLENKDIPPFVLGAFFSRSILNSDYIYTEASSGAGNKPDQFTLTKFKSNKNKYIVKVRDKKTTQEVTRYYIDIELGTVTE